MTSLSNLSEVKLEAGHYGRTVIARLKPNEDLVESLERLCAQYGIGRAVVRSAVGSLIDGALSSGVGTVQATQIVKGPGVEIVGLFGEVEGVVADRDTTGTTELTAILSGTDSQVFAGRVVRGMNLTFITVEVTLQEWLADADGHAGSA